MRLPRLLAALALFALIASGARAYTPESGIWWNPDEPGSGYTIEIQDDFMVLSYYGGTAGGQPVWYTAAGFLDGNALFANVPLDLTVGSQCVGCPYPGQPTVQPGAGGSVTVAFDANDNTRATLTWSNGRSVQIERFWFYLKRPEDGSAPISVTRMLGEWQVVSDFSENDNASFPYFGDVLVFDQHEFEPSENTWYFDGCRADNSQDGGCSLDNALAFHSASGYFDGSTGLHVIVVDDDVDTWVLYLFETGTNSGQGEVIVYPKDDPFPEDYPAYPSRLFRTASRIFVEEGTGPSKSAPQQRPGLGGALATVQRRGKSEQGSRFDLARLAPIVRALEAKLQARR